MKLFATSASWASFLEYKCHVNEDSRIIKLLIVSCVGADGFSYQYGPLIAILWPELKDSQLGM